MAVRKGTDRNMPDLNLRRNTAVDAEPFKQRDWAVPSVAAPNGDRSGVAAGHANLTGSNGRHETDSFGPSVDRVVNAISLWAKDCGYFADKFEYDVFVNELYYLLAGRIVTFDSQIWTNLGRDRNPACSSCAIYSAHNSIALPDPPRKFSSARGVNISSLTSTQPHAGNLQVSNLVHKQSPPKEGCIENSSQPRQMFVLDFAHSEISAFIQGKAILTQLSRAGGKMDEYVDISLKTDYCVRISDELMKAALAGQEIVLNHAITGNDVQTRRADHVLEEVVTAAHASGNPGLQFADSINRWNTCSISGDIWASSSRGDFFFLNDTCCPAASINLVSLLNENGFDLDSFLHAVTMLCLSLDTIVGNESYPNPTMAKKVQRFRPIGIGFHDLGALLMTMGLPYDSDDGRALAAAIAAAMTGQAYLTSAKLASRRGSFAGFEENKSPMLCVLEQHIWHLERMQKTKTNGRIRERALRSFREARKLGTQHGFRNAQVSQIGSLQGRSGIEPVLRLVEKKPQMNGNCVVAINQNLVTALRNLGYSADEICRIRQHVENHGTVHGARELSADHVRVFECTSSPVSEAGRVSVPGHTKMLAAVQPFVSGGISKTICLPGKTSIEQVRHVFLDAWREGIKAIRVRCDG